jgi:uridine kinase
VALKSLLTDRLFAAGLLLRLAALILLAPYAQEAWFVPFTRNFLDHPGLDPWTSYAGISPLGFPYGPVMFAGLLPFAGIGALLESVLPVDGAAFAVKAGIAAADIAFLLVMLRFFPRNRRDILIWYWLSPIVLGAGYWAGQLDILPMCLLTLALYLLRGSRFRASAAALACAVSAKFSTAVAVPFVLIYMLKNSRLAPYRVSFCACLALGLLLLCGLPLLSPGYVTMALGTRELDRIFELQLQLGSVPVYLTPILYGVCVYVAWRMRRMSFSLLFSLTGCSLLLLILSTVTPPGWFLWVVPFIAHHACTAPPSQKVPSALFVLTALCSQIFLSNAPEPFTALFAGLRGAALPASLQPCLQSVCVMLGVLLIWGMLREGVFRNDLFKMGLRPVSIAVAGDSGTGKDTCARWIVNLLGEHSTVQINGDDYHLWDRYGSLWKSVTHLSPQANSLNMFFADIRAVLDRKPTYCRTYDHAAGRFKAPARRKTGDFVLAAGLHALYRHEQNRLYDLRIFLDMEENLRTFLKCRRDVLERGHDMSAVLRSIQQRAHDVRLYIRPQLDNAHIVFRLEPETPCSIDNLEYLPKLRLRVMLRDSLYHEALARHLILSTFFSVEAVAGGGGAFEHNMLIRGDCPACILENTARLMMPEADEITVPAMRMESGIAGVMQLIILNHLVQNCKARS